MIRPSSLITTEKEKKNNVDYWQQKSKESILAMNPKTLFRPNGLIGFVKSNSKEYGSSLSERLDINVKEVSTHTFSPPSRRCALISQILYEKVQIYYKVLEQTKNTEIPCEMD